ncbi:MAG: hypothetical protein KDC05_01545 [Bacteroidales bacterium]|nr:hypothetical protein [Bacteroidales bacterium]
MKNLLLTFFGFTFTISLFAYDVSGVAKDSETEDPLAGVDIILSYTTGGIAASAETQPDGSFLLTGVQDGTFNLELYMYPDPVVINGIYYLPSTREEPVVVNGSNVSDLSFMIPPHHPDFKLTGALIDDVTNDTVTIQNFQVQAKMEYLVEFFIDFETENGIYILEGLPDWTYEFTLFENDYYEGVSTGITINPNDPETVHMDFYVEPKMGTTVSGVLIDSTTNQPILQAGRTIKIQAINSFFTQTNEQGEFTFINIPPGSYAGIQVTSQDTDYVFCQGSEIDGLMVPEVGLDDIQLYQKPWVSIHEVTADASDFEPGETKTVNFSVANDDLSYGAIWGVNLIFPEGVTVLNSTPFYGVNGNEVIFDKLPDCSTSEKKAWEGWHWVGIPPYASSEGNLDLLNESASSDVTLVFDDSASMEVASIFYEIYYDIHCNTIQPFSYGTIMMENDNITTGEPPVPTEKMARVDMELYPNPARSKFVLWTDMNMTMTCNFMISKISGEKVFNLEKTFKEGSSRTVINTGGFENGVYYCSLISDKLKIVKRLLISR